jgi:hypothetical protein
MAHVAPLDAVVRPTRRAGHGRHISVLSRYTARRRIGTIARHDHLHIDVTIPGSNRDPRSDAAALAGIRIHRSPSLHPDDVVTLPSGLRITSVSRTLIDLAEELTADELRDAFAAARSRELLDMAAVRRSCMRLEWRPSLAMLDELIAEFEHGPAPTPR